MFLSILMFPLEKERWTLVLSNPFRQVFAI